MDIQALFKLSYGVFMLASRDGEKKSGCITNTCMQTASDPTRVAIAVINTNYTCEIIKKSGVFAVTVLDESCPFETIAHFGYQSGRTVDKFEGMELPADCNGIPYLPWCSCAVLSAKVVQSVDLGSHTLFIGELLDAKTLSGEHPMTYAYYQEKVKPKPSAKKEEKKPVSWRCNICGYVYEGSELPKDFVCPLCGHGPEDFEPVYA